MSDVSYSKPYPTGWKNKPNRTTPFNAIAGAMVDAGIDQATAQANLAVRDRRRRGLPSYVDPNLVAGDFEPASGFYNLKPSNTRRLRQGLGRAATGGDANVLVVSDSSGAGCVQGGVTPFVFDRLNAWPLAMGAALTRRGVPKGGTGIIRWVDSSNIDARCTSTGTWNSFNAYASSTANGSTLVCTLTAADFSSLSSYSMAAVWYFDFGSATFTVKKGATTVATVTMGTSNTWKRLVITGQTWAAGDALTITKTNTTQTLFSGVSFWTPSAGLVVHNASQSGSRAASVSGSNTNWSDSAALGLVYKNVAGPATGGRTVTDAAFTSGSPTLTSATAAFTAEDVGRPLARSNSQYAFPDNTYISGYTNATTVTMSANAVNTATAQTITVGRPPDCVLISLGANDHPVITTAIATITAAITTIRGFWPNSDAVLVLEEQQETSLQPQANWESYGLALYQLADTLDVPLFDQYHRIGSYTQGVANGVYGDALAHLTSAAYVDWGVAMAAGLR
jgi:hypothetical protein